MFHFFAFMLSLSNNPFKSILAPEFNFARISCLHGIETVVCLYFFLFIFSLRFFCFQTNPAFQCFHFNKCKQTKLHFFCPRGCKFLLLQKQSVSRILVIVEFMVSLEQHLIVRRRKCNLNINVLWKLWFFILGILYL